LFEDLKKPFPGVPFVAIVVFRFWILVIKWIPPSDIPSIANGNRKDNLGTRKKRRETRTGKDGATLRRAMINPDPGAIPPV
jgi:hypothetical protein